MTFAGWAAEPQRGDICSAAFHPRAGYLRGPRLPRVGMNALALPPSPKVCDACTHAWLINTHASTHAHLHAQLNICRSGVRPRHRHRHHLCFFMTGGNSQVALLQPAALLQPPPVALAQSRTLVRSGNTIWSRKSWRTEKEAD